MSIACGLKHQIRLWNIELFKKNITHFRASMLASMNNPLINPACFLQLLVKNSQLNELRPIPNYVYNIFQVILADSFS
jgi:hypothetical protein